MHRNPANGYRHGRGDAGSKTCSSLGEVQFSPHTSEVRPGNIILAFAKREGIIAVSVAECSCEILEGDSNRRIRSFKEYPYAEWRVPTRWTIRVDNEDALPYRDAANASVANVSGEQYDGLRAAIKEHFLA